MKELDFFGPDATFHHVGMVVRSIAAASPEVTSIFDPLQRVAVGFLSMNGLVVELVEPQGEDSPVARSLRSGQKLLHLCYEVPDLAAAIECCKASGLRLLRNPVPAVAFEGRRIAWLFSNQYGLFELLERAPQAPS